MLESIKIVNLALIEKSSVEFSGGFNVLTGETGAGKSLIVDALLFLTGIRADKTLIKSGEDYARVDGVFSVDINDNEITEVLASIGLENEGTIIISRQFNVTGKNECRINGEMVTLNIIKKLSSLIIDIFGQNDSQILLDSSNHLFLIDNMFNDCLQKDKGILASKLHDLNILNNSIKELGGLDKDRENNLALLKFQIEEIDNADLIDGQEEELKSKILTMQNSEKIYNALDTICQYLDGEYSLENSIKSAINTLSSIESFDEEYPKHKDRLYSIKYELQDVISDLAAKKDSIVYSEEQLDILQDKLTSIKDLERKYGNTISDILNTREILGERYDRLINADEELERLRLNKGKLLQEILSICEKLRETRVREIAKFKEKILIELKELGMKNASFEVAFLNEMNLDNIESIVNCDGADSVEFLFSANLGVEPRPLTKIISGGEMSRFMLAFKSLQNSNSNKTCIFDEIDTGIGGEVGGIVGKKIVQISKNTQVICITHLPQIASFGDVNFKIEKFEDDLHTITNVKVLSQDEKVDEIARMLGSSRNEISISHAREIIDDSIAYKKYISNM